MKAESRSGPGIELAIDPIAGTERQPEIESVDLKRRQFCSRLLLSSGLLVGATLLSARTEAQPVGQVVFPPQRIEGAESLMPGSALYFTYPTRTDPAILVRNSDGEYYAYSCKCSHQGCSVYFERASRRLECPCHKGSYDLKTGFVMFGPPTRSLDQIVVRLRAGGELWAVGRTVSADNP